MSPPRVEGASEAQPHPAMIFWPSFKQMAEAAAARRMTDPEEDEGKEQHDACSSCSASDDDDDFEFAPVSGRSDAAFAGADALLFPVFHSSPILRDEDVGRPNPGHGSEQPEAGDDAREDGADYCIWRPKPRSEPEPEPEPPALEAAGKSRSTGGVPARSPKREDHAAAAVRSVSDGAGRFRFLPSPSRTAASAAAAPPVKTAGGRPRKEKKKKATETDLATAHRLFYSNHQDGRAAAGGHARRSYLPYRKDLVGFFAGGTRFLPF